MNRAGPYAAALIGRERTVFVEWFDEGMRRVRCAGRLLGGTRRGEILTVELVGERAADVPGAGAGITLVVPTPNALWHFITFVADTDGRSPSGVASTSMIWPLEVIQEMGRRAPRVECVLPVTMSFADAGASLTMQPICTYTLDLSEGGAQIAVPRPLEVGTPVALDIRLPREMVSASATVAWSRAVRDVPGDPMYGTGFRFAPLAPHTSTRLRIVIGMYGQVSG